MIRYIILLLTITTILANTNYSQEAKSIIEKKQQIDSSQIIDKNKQAQEDSIKQKGKKIEVKKNDEKSKDEKSKKEGKTDIKENPLLTFTKDINPLIQKTCMPCHAESESNASELYFDSYESIFKGGKHGNPIIPGKGDSSMFVKKLLTNPPFGDQMPTPKRKPKLSEDQIKIFIEWINQGAKKN